jgi:hypothetical protein
VYNGATYYIDVFGKRFQNELEAMVRIIHPSSLLISEPS